MIDDLWYKNAVIYCLDVEKYVDADGDGVGDFAGLTQRLAYLAGLGVTCVWLQPFYPSPNKDNGYDVADYYGVHPRLGTLGEYVEFMNLAEQLGVRVIVDLVVNHTSDQPPLVPRRPQGPRLPVPRLVRLVQVPPKDYRDGIVFPGVQKSTWTRDPVANAYYFHRFYDFQPDLNTAEPGRPPGDPAGHGLLAPARRLRLPHGRRPLPDQPEGRRPRAPRAGLRAAARRCGSSCSGAAATPSCWPRRTCRRARARELLRPRRRPHPDDAQLPGEPAALLRPGHRRPAAARQRAGGDPRPPADRPVVQLPPQPRRAGPGPADATPSGRRCSTPSRRRLRTCSSTTAASAGGSPRCWTTTAGSWSWPSACCSPSPARRCSSSATRSAWATTSRCPSASAPARRCSGRRSPAPASPPAAGRCRPVIDDPVYGYRTVNVADAAPRPRSRC